MSQTIQEKNEAELIKTERKIAVLNQQTLPNDENLQATIAERIALLEAKAAKLREELA